MSMESDERGPQGYPRPEQYHTRGTGEGPLFGSPSMPESGRPEPAEHDDPEERSAPQPVERPQDVPERNALETETGEGEVTSVDLTETLESTFRGVQHGSSEHRALIHLIALANKREELRQAEAKAAEAQEADAPNGAGNGKAVAKVSGEIIGIHSVIEGDRQLDKPYKTASVTTDLFIRGLERAYSREGVEDPVAKTVATLRHINERIRPDDPDPEHMRAVSPPREGRRITDR